jgi:two-component system OmpR family sensor kinase
MFSSLRSRLWLSYALMVGANLFIIASVLVIYLIRNPLAFRLTLSRLRTVESVLLAEKPDLASLAPEKLQTSLAEYDKVFDVRILILEKNGSLLADTRLETAPAFPVNFIRVFRLSPTIRDANKQAWLVSINRISDKKWLVLAAPRPKVQILNLLRDEMIPPFFIAGVVALLLSLFMAFGLARWIADPLQKILEAANQFPVYKEMNLALLGPREVKDLTRAFNQMTSRVQVSQKSQRDFVANVSHELKTPLTSIQGFSQALLDGAANTPESQQQAAAIIHQESERMHRLVTDLLDLARLDAGTADLQKTRLDLKPLLEGVVEKFKPQTEQAHVNLSHRIPNLPEIIGDPDRLSQIFINLLDNSIKFTPAGGEVDLQACATDQWVEISLKDTGPGISAEEIPHIFERFYQGDPSRKGGAEHGTGLGLAIVHEIVQAHDGTIKVYSILGQGSTFIIQLPVPGITLVKTIK